MRHPIRQRYVQDHVGANPLGDSPWPVIIGTSAIVLLGAGIFYATRPRGVRPAPTPIILPVQTRPSSVTVVTPPSSVPSPTPTPSAQIGKWVPVTSMTNGHRYRASANMAGYFAIKGYKVYTDGMPIPVDWPVSDLDPKRWRIERKWQFNNTPVLPEWTAAGAMFFELVAGNWVPAANLTNGTVYRMSIDARSIVSIHGISLIVPPQPVPSDWPTDDLDPSRWRAEGFWQFDNGPISSSIINAIHLKVYEFQIG